MAIISTQTGKELPPEEINFDLLDSDTQQQLVTDWVNSNVIQCITYLVENNLKLDDEDTEKLDSMALSYDYEETARQNNWIRLSEWLQGSSTATKWGIVKEMYSGCISDALEDENTYVETYPCHGIDLIALSEYEDWEELCNEEGLDCIPDEVYEYYIVSHHFNAYVGGAENLAGLLIWPRFCTGQHIALDDNVITAYREFHNRWLYL